MTTTMTVNDFCAKVHLPSVVSRFQWETPKAYHKIPGYGWYAEAKNASGKLSDANEVIHNIIKKTIKETLQWLKKVKPDETDITIVSIYPGSSYFEKSVMVNDNLMKYTNERTNDNLYIRNIDFLHDSNFYKSKSDEYIICFY